SLILSGAITSLVVLINYLLPQKAFSLLMALVVATLLLNWIMIFPLDQPTLKRLAHLVYDVRRDDAPLRKVAGIPGEFDKLRKNYL
ncbi:DUF3410 domain-containing protein, partial [Salmonella enterica subsp. enterica serovar Agona]|nr:DUF3410 domain-containing protein [Salmonella enterica subsp. enterica serovar Agona]